MPTAFNTVLPALLATLVIEAIFILPFFRSHCENFPKLVINFILINAITNLSINSLLILTKGASMGLLLDLFVPLIEAYMFKFGGVTRSNKSTVIICYISNIFSYIAGLYIILDRLFAFYDMQPKPEYRFPIMFILGAIQ